MCFFTNTSEIEDFISQKKPSLMGNFTVMRKHTHVDLEPCPPPLISIHIPASNGLLMSWTGVQWGAGVKEVMICSFLEYEFNYSCF